MEIQGKYFGINSLCSIEMPAKCGALLPSVDVVETMEPSKAHMNAGNVGSSGGVAAAGGVTGRVSLESLKNRLVKRRSVAALRGLSLRASHSSVHRSDEALSGALQFGEHEGLGLKCAMDRIAETQLALEAMVAELRLIHASHSHASHASHLHTSVLQTPTTTTTSSRQKREELVNVAAIRPRTDFASSTEQTSDTDTHFPASIQADYTLDILEEEPSVDYFEQVVAADIPQLPSSPVTSPVQRQTVRRVTSFQISSLSSSAPSNFKNQFGGSLYRDPDETLSFSPIAEETPASRRHRHLSNRQSMAYLSSFAVAPRSDSWSDTATLNNNDNVNEEAETEQEQQYDRVKSLIEGLLTQASEALNNAVLEEEGPLVEKGDGEDKFCCPQRLFIKGSSLTCEVASAKITSEMRLLDDYSEFSDYSSTLKADIPFTIPSFQHTPPTAATTQMSYIDWFNTVDNPVTDSSAASSAPCLQIRPADLYTHADLIVGAVPHLCARAERSILSASPDDNDAAIARVQGIFALLARVLAAAVAAAPDIGTVTTVTIPTAVPVSVPEVEGVVLVERFVRRAKAGRTPRGAKRNRVRRIASLTDSYDTASDEDGVVQVTPKDVNSRPDRLLETQFQVSALEMELQYGPVVVSDRGLFDTVSTVIGLQFTLLYILTTTVWMAARNTVGILAPSITPPQARNGFQIQRRQTLKISSTRTGYQ
ncbi:hypothetical protein BC830DRAFT_1120018 [Chytriomyces sp. MP71]|nr:hypothetical protein BC830DRAFT_1120018 [Chytriomyces sp. MP71]